MDIIILYITNPNMPPPHLLVLPSQTTCGRNCPLQIMLFIRGVSTQVDRIALRKHRGCLQKLCLCRCSVMRTRKVNFCSSDWSWWFKTRWLKLIFLVVIDHACLYFGRQMAVLHCSATHTILGWVTLLKAPSSDRASCHVVFPWFIDIVTVLAINQLPMI